MDMGADPPLAMDGCGSCAVLSILRSWKGISLTFERN